jgi:hypothetical protein
MTAKYPDDESFINNEVLSDESNSSSDEDSDKESTTSVCKIVVPSKKYRKSSDTSHEILSQLLLRSNELALTQKKLYKTKSALTKEEVICRYVKLDLNNFQLKVEEFKKKLVDCRKHLFFSRVENWINRIIIVMYILWVIYSKIF